jgi:hypothetical protein
MTKSISAAVLAVAMLLGDATTASSLAAAPTGVAAQRAQATMTNASARRRHYRRAYDAYRPYYYGRPTYYSPSPFFLPVPPLWGYGWEWW